MADPIYSIVIPVYGSAVTLSELHRRLSEVMQAITPAFEIVMVDDCSPDKTWNVLQELAARDDRLTIVQLMRNAGQGAATLCGLAQARGKFIITMDDDLQHPPEEIPVLIESLRENPDLDVVMGRPIEKSHHPVRKLGSRFMHEANSLLLGKSRSIYFTSFRIMRRQAVDALLNLRSLHPALGPMLSTVTRRIGNVPVRHEERKAGNSGYSPTVILRQLLGNFVGYSMLPLRLVGIIGSVGVTISIFLGLVFLVRYLGGGITVPGWTTIVLLLVMLSGVTFFAFAVLGEYVLKILQLSSATPQYVVRSIQRNLETGDDPVQPSENDEPGNLCDGVVYLRKLRRTDLSRTLEWMARPEINQAMGVKTPITEESQKRWFEHLSRSDDKVVFALCKSQDDEHIGNLSLDTIDMRHLTARLSIFIADRNTRGKGFGPRAMKLLMVEAFENRGLRKIWCKTTTGNEKVLNFYRELGFVEEGVMREHEMVAGKPVDKLIMGILRREWKSKH